MSLMPTFAQPFWLLTGLMTCLAVLLFIFLNIRRRKNELEKFAAPKLLAGLTSNISRSRRRGKNILFVLGIAFLFLALARPQYGERWIEVRRKGIDILIGVDVSKSMLVQDIKPSRLGRAKLAIRDFVAQLEGDRVGLLPFAGTAFLMCPLTTDYEAFNASLTTLDAGSIPKGGTDLGLAIRQAGKVLSNEVNHKIFILVTDGEDLSREALQAAEEAKEQNMTVYTIGVGTPEGELIPVFQGQMGRFIKDDQGNFITSKLDEQTLTTLAEITGGFYVPLGSTGQGFETIYEQKLTLVPEEEHGQRRRKIPIERFPWPLGVAVLLLSMDFLITGRRGRSLRLPFVKTAGRRKKRVVVTALVVTLGALSSFIFSQARASEGEELFQAGDYAEAEAYYQQSLEKDTSNPALYFNLGGSLYRQQKYEQAAAAFTQALGTDDLSLQAQSYYNRGNSQFFLGAATATEEQEQALKQWNAAKKSFEAALKLNPEDKAATHNLEMVTKKLEQLKEAMRQSGKQCDNPQEGENGEQQKKESQEKQDKQGEQKEDQQDSDQEQKQEEQKDQSGSAEEQESDPQEQPGTEQEQGEEQSEKQKAVPEPEKQEEPPTAEDIQQAAAQEEQKEEQNEEQNEEQGAQQQMSAEDMERRMMGKMTEQEAKNLLNSLKGEQGELNFIPQGMGNNGSVDKDW